MKTITLKTGSRTEMIDITAEIRSIIKAENFSNGICMLYVPHTTAGITINEAADPDVRRDILMVLNQMVPWQADYRHMEGNSPAHIKSSLMGASEMVAVENGKMVLGTWQGIFYCDFDGPRTRKLHIKLIPNPA
ncbi:MAG: secondary thiamine-phosphate synthase enzyme YjbQ [Desulfobacteraceae bacterium]|jgi:secondary thiamine-phosphate synthase enzyme